MQETATSPATTRPRVFYGWYIVAASVCTNAIFSAAYYQGFSALVLPIEQTFGWSRSVMSAAGAMRQLESGIISPFLGILLDRFSARKVVMLSAVIAALGMIGLGFMNGIVTFYVFFVLVSLGASGLSHAVTWPVLIARWFRRKRGLAVGIAVMGPIFGSPFVILNTSLEDQLGWRAVFIIYGVVILIGCTLISLVIRDRPEPYGLRPDGDDPDEPAEVTSARGKNALYSGAGFTLREAMRMREFWVFAVYMSGMFVVNSAFQFHQIPYFEQDKDFSAAEAATSLTLVFVTSGLGRLGSGFLLDKLDYRFVLTAVSLMMGLSFLYLQLGSVDNVLQSVPFVLLFGIGLGAMIPLRGALGGMLFGTRSIGSILGVLQGGAVAASVVGPIFMGAIFDINGNYSLAMWILVAISVSMAPVSFVMRSTTTIARQRSEADATL